MNDYDYECDYLEDELLCKMENIKQDIRNLNYEKMKTSYIHRKKEITYKIQALEHELEELENYLINDVRSQYLIDEKIRLWKKEIKEIEYLLASKKLSRSEYNRLLNMKLDLSIFISQNINKNTENYPSKTYINEYDNYDDYSHEDYQDYDYENRRRFIPKYRTKKNITSEEVNLKKDQEEIKESSIERNGQEVNVHENKEEKAEIREIIKEVPIEVIKEVPIEIIKEVPIEVIKEVPIETYNGEYRAVNYNPYQGIKEIIVPVEVIHQNKLDSNGINNELNYFHEVNGYQNMSDINNFEEFQYQPNQPIIADEFKKEEEFQYGKYFINEQENAQPYEYVETDFSMGQDYYEDNSSYDENEFDLSKID